MCSNTKFDYNSSSSPSDQSDKTFLAKLNPEAFFEMELSMHRVKSIATDKEHYKRFLVQRVHEWLY